jgi:uncharacterized phage protein gp47/JayE
MSFLFTSAGLTIQNYAAVLADVQSEFRSRISARVATSAGSLLGQIQRIVALYHYRDQEKLQQLYQSFDPRLAEGVHLDIRLAGLGVTREPALRAEVLGTITSTGNLTVADGTRFAVGGFTFATIDGPYSRVGAGTITGVRLRSELYQPIDVSTLGAWTILDAIADMDSFDDTSQPIAGRVEEADSAYRARAEIERYARASGPLEALDAGVGLAVGVDYARAYHNTDPTTDPDANGIPYDSVNVVVDGGTDADVAAAIVAYGPAATRFFGATEVTVGSGARAQLVGFDRVADVDMHIRVSVTTSTSEDADQALGTAELQEAVEVALEAYAAASWTIGKDVIPAELAAAIMSAGIPAIDAITVEIGDDGIAWQTTKYEISVRERAAYSDARVEPVVET